MPFRKAKVFKVSTESKKAGTKQSPQGARARESLAEGRKAIDTSDNLTGNTGTSSTGTTSGNPGNGGNTGQKATQGVNRQGKPLTQKARERIEAGYKRVKAEVKQAQQAQQAQTARDFTAQTSTPKSPDETKKEKEQKQRDKLQREELNLRKQELLRRQGFRAQIGKFKLTSTQEFVGFAILAIAVLEIGFIGKVGAIWKAAFKTG